MAEYKLKTGKVGEKAVQTYRAIEDGVVSGYKKIENAFVDAFLEKVPEGEAAPVGSGVGQQATKGALDLNRKITERHIPKESQE